MAAYDQLETQTMAISVTPNYATFDGGIQGLHIATTQDCHVDFDRVASTSSMLIKANQNPVYFGFAGSNVQKIYVRTASSTGTVYLLGVRGKQS